MIDLDALEEAAKKATPGPWEADGLEGNLEAAAGRVAEVTMWLEADAEFIAAANPAVILELVSWLRHAKEEIERLTAHAQELRDIFEYRAGVIESFDNPDEAIAAEHKAIAENIRLDLTSVRPLAEGDFID